MVGLVQPFVAYGMVFPAVNPVDAVVRENQEAVITWINLGEYSCSKEEIGTYKNIEKMRYGHPYVSTSLYSMEYPMTSAWNHGKVKMIIEGKALMLC